MAESRPDVMPIAPLGRGAAAQDERDERDPLEDAPDHGRLAGGGALDGDDDLDGDDLDDDPLIAGFVERAVAPYRGLLPPDELVELEELLGDILATHPAVAPAVDRLRKQNPPSQSGARLKRGGRGQ